MIVLPKQKVVIITPPHTASRHLHYAMCSPEVGGIYIQGKNFNGSFDHHNTEIPDEFLNFKRYLVVRHPLGRLVGLWMHHCWATSNLLDWPTFLTHVVYDYPGQTSWLFRWTISRFIEKIDKLDRYIRYENLEDQLSRHLDIQLKLQSKYHDIPNYLDYYSKPYLLRMALNWGFQDCIRLGYPPFEIEGQNIEPLDDYVQLYEKFKDFNFATNLHKVD